MQRQILQPVEYWFQFDSARDGNTGRIRSDIEIPNSFLPTWATVYTRAGIIFDAGGPCIIDLELLTVAAAFVATYWQFSLLNTGSLATPNAVIAIDTANSSATLPADLTGRNFLGINITGPPGAQQANGILLFQVQGYLQAAIS